MKRFILFALLIVLISACKKDNTEEPTPNPNPYVPETIMSGKVKLVNQFGENLSEFEPINVYINDEKHTETSNTGEFELWDLQDNETIILSFSSSTVGTLYIYDFTFINEGNIEDIFLTEKSDSRIEEISYYPPSNVDVPISYLGVHELRPNDRFIRVYFDTVPEVSSKKYVFTRKSKYRAIEGIRNWTWVLYDEWDYKKYDTIYARIYGTAAEGSNYQTYIDPETGLMIDPGINDDESQSMFVACEIIDWKENK